MPGGGGAMISLNVEGGGSSGESVFEREVAGIFSPTGLLSGAASFEFREEQQRMAREVAGALDTGSSLAIEAGTGVGKSLAYLIPCALHAKATRRKAVISTHTIALQEQLIHKDIPLVQKLLPVEFDAVLLKGRHNFLCGTRLDRALASSGDLFLPEERKELERLREWSLTTRDGSLTDFIEQPAPRVWEEVRSEPGICSPKVCGAHPRCFYQALRRRVLGAGFAFVGRQVHVEVGDKDFYIDLLFYHLKLRCYVVVELKAGEFQPEYAGKLNFYLSAVDSQLRHPSDNPSLGLLLCKNRDKVVAEYALRDMNKPIGVAEYQLVQALPKELQTDLPRIEDIESELRDADDAPGEAQA